MLVLGEVELRYLLGEVEAGAEEAVAVAGGCRVAAATPLGSLGEAEATVLADPGSLGEAEAVANGVVLADPDALADAAAGGRDTATVLAGGRVAGGKLTALPLLFRRLARSARLAGVEGDALLSPPPLPDDLMPAAPPPPDFTGGVKPAPPAPAPDWCRGAGSAAPPPERTT